MKGGISTSRRKIYSTELKLEVMQRYLVKNINLNQLVKEYRISAKPVWKNDLLFIENMTKPNYVPLMKLIMEFLKFLL